MRLEIRNATCGYDHRNVVKDISFSLETGEILCLLGPNGVGKTTLFKAILGFLRLRQGAILLDDEDVKSWSRGRMARALGYVPQAQTSPFPFKVLDMVVMGRTAHLGIAGSPAPADMEIAEEALEILNVSFLKDRIYTQISGGERQMVLIARALAQQTSILVMDEPTSNLDFGNQVRVLQQISNLAKRGLSIIMTSHFPDHAFLCATKVALMQRNYGFSMGSADEVVTEANLKAAYGVGVTIASINNGTGEPIKVCVPLLAR